MKHDPTLIKPLADYHRRKPPMVVIKPQAYPAKPKPVPREWMVSQYAPIVQSGLAATGTNAAAMLNLSHLPGDAPPGVCLAWAHSFCQALEGGLRAPDAAEAADRNIHYGR